MLLESLYPHLGKLGKPSLPALKDSVFLLVITITQKLTAYSGNSNGNIANPI
ncbi:MAG: hypothetical protein PV347_01090 [Rickettsiaceae bacterium]|nr:hypothetical protein [Rickettsiaceae bacterium]